MPLPEPSPTRFSLVLATIERTDPLEKFFVSLTAQNYPNLQVLVVDQNKDNRLLPLLQKFEHLGIQRITSSPGLSRARNAALGLCRGDIIAFPDDDCWYPPRLLDEVAAWFKQNAAAGGITCMAQDENGLPSSGRWLTSSVRLNRSNVWAAGTSYTIFLRQKLVASIGSFDEELGVGAGTPWGAGEDIDYLIRGAALSPVFYLPHLRVFHPNPAMSFSEAMIARGYRYGAGMGRVLRKHHYPFYQRTYLALRPLARAAMAMATGKSQFAHYHWSTMRGRLHGAFSHMSEASPG